MSTINTVLIVILLILVVGFGSYLYVQNEKKEMGNDDASLQLKLGGDSEN